MKATVKKVVLRKIGVVLLFLLFVGSAFSWGQEVRVPVDMQLELFSKVLIFDRNLRSRVNNEIIFGIVYQSLYRASLHAAEVFQESLDRLPGNKLCDLPVRVVMIDLEENKALDKAVLENRLNILYIAPLKAFDLKAISAISQAHKILTLTGVPDYLQSDISISIDSVGGKPKVLINLPAAISEGSDFSSKLLNLATLVVPKSNPRR